MNKATVNLHKIALRVRRWTLDFQRKHNDKYPTDLVGLCGIASARLYSELVKAGYKPQIAYCRYLQFGHVFVVCDGYVIDLTSSQFCNAPKFTFQAVDHFNQDKWWKTYSVMEGLDELEEEQLEWVEDHQFATYKNEVLGYGKA